MMDEESRLTTGPSNKSSSLVVEKKELKLKE